MITILPEQAKKIAEVTAKTGAAISVSQYGSTLTLGLGSSKLRIDAKGEEIKPQEEQLC